MIDNYFYNRSSQNRSIIYMKIHMKRKKISFCFYISQIQLGKNWWSKTKCIKILSENTTKVAHFSEIIINFLHFDWYSKK